MVSTVTQSRGDLIRSVVGLIYYGMLTFYSTASFQNALTADSTDKYVHHMHTHTHTLMTVFIHLSSADTVGNV